MKSTIGIICAVLSLSACNPSIRPDYVTNETVHPNRGLYAIWTNGPADEALSFPLIRGGQVVVQWADVNPQPGVFDFSRVEQKLRRMQDRNLIATVQIHGNRKPLWLFDTVPYSPTAITRQVRDELGTLMYWHPRFLEANTAMIRAFGAYLATSEYKPVIAGIRQNMNGIGTEHLWLPPKHRARRLWKALHEDDWIPYSDAIRDRYATEIVQTYIDSIPTEFTLLLRTSMPAPLLKKIQPELTGRLGLFHTSSEIEPRPGRGDQTYRVLFENARMGDTTAYAESWADAWGRHGSVTDSRVLSPAQWNYWRLLFDLHNGVSMIAIYSRDLREAVIEGKDGWTMDDQFYSAFSFAAKYAGFHAAPEVSPGAWIAFRDTKPTSKHPLRDPLFNDLSFHLERVSGGSHVRSLVGPRTQRFGAWARQIGNGDTLELELDSCFSRSLSGTPATISITVFADNAAEIVLNAGDKAQQLHTAPSNQWITLHSKPVLFPATDHAPGRRIQLSSNQAIWVHLVEVHRPPEQHDTARC